VGVVAARSDVWAAEGWPALEATAAKRVGGGEQDAAVIVAIEDYAILPDVEGAVANGLAWEQYLSDARGVPSVRLLRNQKGTRESIETALDAAAKDVGPGGTLWFIFIGHGAASQDRTDGVLAGWDAQQELNTFYPNSVARADVARRLAGKGKQRVMVLDACFSGKTASGTSIFGDKQPIVPVQMSPVPQAVVLSAAASDEMAGGLPVSARPRPAFSYLVLGAMRGWGDGADGTAPDGVVDANEAVAYARKALRRLDATRQQTPEASGSATLAKSAGEKGPDLGAMLAGSVAPGRDFSPGFVVRPPGPDPIAEALAAEAALKAQEENLRRVRAQAQTALDAEVERDWARVSGSTSAPVLEAFLTKFADRRVGDHRLTNVREGDARAALGRLKAKDLPSGYVRIEPGRFTMGSPGGEEGRDDDEVQHEVRITRAFALKKTEVTQGEWRAVMGTSPSYHRDCGDNCPVENVSWFDAVTYLNRLSQREGLSVCYALSGYTGTPGGGCSASENNGRYCTGDYTCGSAEPVAQCTGYRLPTEAEWEYAARAGTTGARHGALDDVAWHSGNSGSTTHAVGTRAANAWGLHDMMGNVWELTQDWYGAYTGAASDPAGPASGEFRVDRGGSWSSVARSVRSARRYWSAPADRDYYLGFRPSRSL
jgi:formylglycine-generating enzyme required for sulfatase activity